jgi:hypothetical protein
MQKPLIFLKWGLKAGFLYQKSLKTGIIFGYF